MISDPVIRFNVVVHGLEIISQCNITQEITVPISVKTQLYVVGDGVAVIRTCVSEIVFR